MAGLLSGFYRKHRSLTARYPIESHEDYGMCSKAASDSLWA